MYYKRNFGIAPHTIGGLMEDLFHNGFNRTHEEANLFTVPVNIRETETGYELHVIAPGLKKEDLKLNVDRNLLHISYEQKEQPKEENKEQVNEGKWLRSEYKMKSFKRTFTLTEKIDAGKISAKYNDGVLLVTLGKKEVVEPATQEITVN